MAFLTRSVKEMLEDALQLLQENTSITRLSPGGKARAILDIVVQLSNEIYREFDLGLVRAFIDGAQGQYLDLFGSILACPRLPSETGSADAEMENVKFYVEANTFGDINNGNDIQLTRGTIVSTGANRTGNTYRLSSSFTAPAASSAVWVSVEATNPGDDYNVGSSNLIYHNFTGYTDYLNQTLKVTNIHSIANGKGFESDANYKYRLTNKVTDAEAANETSIRLAALSCPGVADVVMEKHYRGIGTFGIIIKSTTPTASDNLINLVTSRVLSVMGYGGIHYIRAQRIAGFAMKTRVWYKERLSSDELDDIEVAMDEYIINFVNNLDLGEVLNTDRMLAGLFAISDNIQNFGSSTRSIDESWIYRPTKLADNRIPEKLLGSYEPDEDERVVIEPTLSTPIIFERKYGRRPGNV